MGPTLTALLDLQDIERDLSRLRRRMRTRTVAVTAQENKIAKLTKERETLSATSMEKRVKADEMELSLKEADDRSEKLRSALNSAKTNKEYAGLLTEINTQKADNAKFEEEALKTIAQVDALKKQIEQIDSALIEENAKLDTVKASNSDEIEKLTGMISALEEKRDRAAIKVAPEILKEFNILVEKYEGEAMANIEQSGVRAPYTYTCGGCFMQLTAEHANALSHKDEIRQCDNCKRILYVMDYEDDGF